MYLFKKGIISKQQQQQQQQKPSQGAGHRRADVHLFHVCSCIFYKQNTFLVCGFICLCVVLLFWIFSIYWDPIGPHWPQWAPISYYWPYWPLLTDLLAALLVAIYVTCMVAHTLYIFQSVYLAPTLAASNKP